MDLIFWRHAQAHDLSVDVASNAPDWREADLARALTPKGQRQAQHMAQWLNRQLPDTVQIVCSPAVRALATAQAVGRQVMVDTRLSPTSHLRDLLEVVPWRADDACTVVVGHQPTLGQAIAHLIGLQTGDCSVRKGAIWWLRLRMRAGVRETVVVSVQAPDLL